VVSVPVYIFTLRISDRLAVLEMLLAHPLAASSVTRNAGDARNNMFNTEHRFVSFRTCKKQLWCNVGIDYLLPIFNLKEYNK
jgi:hypothetical protein